MIGSRSKKRGVEIKIIDFGVAQLYPNRKFVANKPVGKTGYMAPEVFNRKTVCCICVCEWCICISKCLHVFMCFVV